MFLSMSGAGADDAFDLDALLEVGVSHLLIACPATSLQVSIEHLDLSRARRAHCLAILTPLWYPRALTHTHSRALTHTHKRIASACMPGHQ